MRYRRKKVGKMNTVVERYCPITESLEESLKQMKMIRQGQLPRKSWNELKRELKIERESIKILKMI